MNCLGVGMLISKIVTMSSNVYIKGVTWRIMKNNGQNIFYQSIFVRPLFLSATKHLYNWLCLSVGWSVTHSFDNQHVTPIGLLGLVAPTLLNFHIFKCDKAPLQISVSIGRSFNDPHAAPCLPTWSCFKMRPRISRIGCVRQSVGWLVGWLVGNAFIKNIKIKHFLKRKVVLPQ